MDSLIYKIIFFQWQRKLFALGTAIVIWFFVNHSITATKTVPTVPIKIINLPSDKTIQGMLPNGFLSKRATLTLSGTKGIIEQLEPGDIEVLLDVSTLPNEALVTINKKNLISLNPGINLSKYVTSVTSPEIVIKMNPILTEKVTIHVLPPTGSAPEGYEFLDIWPLALSQTVTGPQDLVLQLKNQGLEFTINLSDITKEQLDELQAKQPNDNEVNFFIPEQWKKTSIPFINRGLIQINDPDAAALQMSFLKQVTLPFTKELPIHVYYPLKHLSTINPQTYPLESNTYIKFKDGLSVLELPLLAKNVSQLFLDIIKDNIELEIVAAPSTERERLEWGPGFIDISHLEDTYVAFLLTNMRAKYKFLPSSSLKGRDEYFRRRFRLYMQKFTLHLSQVYPLELESRLENGQIRVHIPNASLL